MKVRIGDQRLRGPLFVAVAPEIAPWVPDAEPTAVLRPGVEHVATWQGSPGIRRRILRALREAQGKVLFCSFIFADEQIVDALCEVAERLRGGVYVITSLDRDLRPDRSEAEDSFDEDRREAHRAALARLSQAGAWLRGVPDCHAKFCVVDDELAIVTSANATREAYERNPENGVALRDRSVAHELGRLFAHLFIERPGFDSPPGDRPDVKSLRAPRTVPRWRPRERSGPTRLVATVHDEETHLVDCATELIDAARRTLVIATYSVVDLEDHPVGGALRAALDRGVRLLLVVRPRNLHDPQRAALDWLLADRDPEQVCLVGHRWTHAKALIADGARALVWTGNLDGQHGWTSGIEVGLDTRDPALVEHVERYVGRLAHACDARPVWGEALERAAEVEPGPGAGVASIHVDATRMDQVAAALRSESVTYRRAGGELEMRAGELVLRGPLTEDGSLAATAISNAPSGPHTGFVSGEIELIAATGADRGEHGEKRRSRGRRDR